MDANRLTAPDWMMVVGGVGVFGFSFLHWEKLPGYGSGTNAFDFLGTGVLPWVLMVWVASLVLFLPREYLVENRSRWTLILLGLCLTATGLLLIRVVWNPGMTTYQRGIGMLLTFAASLLALTGAVLKVTRPRVVSDAPAFAPPAIDDRAAQPGAFPPPSGPSSPLPAPDSSPK